MSESECAYKLAEYVKDDDHGRKCGEGSEEFDVADICETGERKTLQGEDRRQISCHWGEDEDKLARPKRREV